MSFLYLQAQLQDMEINESDKDENEDENESESDEPDKQMGDVEEDNQTNEVLFLFFNILLELGSSVSAKSSFKLIDSTTLFSCLCSVIFKHFL